MSAVEVVMEDSIILATLTLMLLKASVQHPESLAADHKMMVLPSRDTLTREEAIRRLAQIESDQTLEASIESGILVVSTREPSDLERQSRLVRATNVEDAIRRLNTNGDATAAVKVVGFQEETVVAERLVRDWLWRTLCVDYSMSVGLPLPNDSTPVVAVLYFGN